MQNWISVIIPELIPMGKMLIGAILTYVIGRWLIRKIVSFTKARLSANSFDSTLAKYIVSLLSIALNIFLIIGILSLFGIETTSFAALIAAMGLAIGAAWSGMLANFAAGVFLIMFKPFKVGDFVTAGGTTGTVKEIGMFATTLATLDNIFTVVGNGKIASETIQNFSEHSYRAVDLRAQLAHGVDPAAAIARLQAAVSQIPNIMADPKALVDILEFNALGTLLVVRPFCHNDHYWQVYFDTNRLIASTLSGAGYPAPSSYQVQMIGKTQK